MKYAVGFFVVAVLVTLFLLPIAELGFGTDKMNDLVAKYYISNGLADHGAANQVTGVVVSYRGFDTLGEVTVLLLASLGVGMLLAQRYDTERPRPGFVTEYGARFLAPYLLVFGAYIFIHGHLTPGGGFQGGAVVATTLALLYLVVMGFQRPRALYWIETLSGWVFAGLGIAGLIVSGSFLSQIMPLGQPYRLLSAGIIVPIYVAIGLKVGIELSDIVKYFYKGGDQA
ncbi:cation:proton antiporter [Coprothermobacteraceae bacterium]|nr:cation:proton antiporter [Coprothermobacteraceae bacterium]